MKKIIFLALTVFCFASGYAQNSLSVTSNSSSTGISVIPPSRNNTAYVLNIPVDKSKQTRIMIPDAVSVDVEGYNGNELVIVGITDRFPKIAPPEAAGLTYIPLDNRPAGDNAITYQVRSDNAESAAINIITQCKYLVIKVPDHMLFFDIDMRSNRNNSNLTVKNIEGPFQVFGRIDTTYISNVTGPFSINPGGTVILTHILWNTGVVWPNSMQHPPFTLRGSYFISSKVIDISIPEDLKATIFSRDRNQVYSDLNLIHEDKYTATLNGGGVKIYTQVLGSGTTYLQKEKN